MDEIELIKIAVFKVAETARRMDTLARAAQTLRGRRLLAAAAQRLAAHEHTLRTSLNDTFANPVVALDRA